MLTLREENFLQRQFDDVSVFTTWHKLDENEREHYRWLFMWIKAFVLEDAKDSERN